MKALLALTSHNIDFCQQALARWKDCPKVSVLGIDMKIEAPSKQQHVLLIPTAATTIKNLRVLNDCPNITVIVFDAPVLCKELGATLLDVEKQTLDYSFRFRKLEFRDVTTVVKRAFLSKDDVKVKRSTIDMSTKLLKRVHGSVLGKFLTFLYRIPDTDRRIELQKEVFDAWWSGDVSAVRKYLQRKYPKNAAAQEFAADLDSEDGKNFVLAVGALRKLKETNKPVAYEKLAKAHKVSAYDLRYYAKGKK